MNWIDPDSQGSLHSIYSQTKNVDNFMALVMEDEIYISSDSPNPKRPKCFKSQLVRGKAVPWIGYL